MIIIRLWGGLGNQMFQYAFGYAIAKETKQELMLDTRFYTNEFIEKNPHFTLQKLNIMRLPLEFTRQINREGELSRICFLQNRTISRIIRIPKSFRIRCDNNLTYVKETRLDVIYDLLDHPLPNAYYDGYWQSEEYFKKYVDDIKSQYIYHNDTISRLTKKWGIDEENSVSVHLRMGDYARRRSFISYNYVISPSYYLSAIDKIKTLVNNPVFFVFSNDIVRAKDLLKKVDNAVFINEDRTLTDLDEFYLMSKCVNHIISNSTFSWWASWLNDKGVCIAPDIVFGNKRILPDRWLRIKVNG